MRADGAAAAVSAKSASRQAGIKNTRVSVSRGCDTARQAAVGEGHSAPRRAQRGVMPGPRCRGCRAGQHLDLLAPRPNTNGSPPLRRATRLPSPARPPAIRGCAPAAVIAVGLADADALRIAACALQHCLAHQPVVENHVGALQQLQRPRVSRSGSPGPAPMRYTSPSDSPTAACCAEPGGEQLAARARSAAAHLRPARGWRRDRRRPAPRARAGSRASARRSASRPRTHECARARRDARAAAPRSARARAAPAPESDRGAHRDTIGERSMMAGR